MVALCGDLWEYPEQFEAKDILLWPVYVDYTIDEWKQNIDDYAKQTNLSHKKTLMINSLCEVPKSYGGAFYFLDGKIIDSLSFGEENILVVNIY